MVYNPLSFVWRYLERAYLLKSILCVGLDPTSKHVPPQFGRGNIGGIESYLHQVIGHAALRVPAVKPQYAYYAALGNGGIEMMCRLIEHAKSRGLLVILDAKRADIGETMEQYGTEVFAMYGVDACTFVPYLGSTIMPPWLPFFKQGCSAISMIRTSNSEAAQLQDLELKNGLLIYEQMAQMVKSWNEQVQTETSGAGGVGGVVGATWPEQAPRCRELAGDDVFFLTPGYGAQGGGAAGAVAGLVNSQNVIMGTVNSSRGITLDSWFNRKTGEPREGDHMDLVIKAIDDANTDLNSALFAKYGSDIYDQRFRVMMGGK